MEQPELIGRRIADKYVIESYLGGGGMGSVYRARQADLDKIIAIKVLHPEFTLEPSFVARFKREAKAASRIDHPNSMRVLDFGQEPDGLLYIVMEYLNGRSLFDILRADAPLEPARITDLFRQALAALAAAHDLGIVHRDLKPDNIVVLQRNDDEGVATEHVKVCDFGIAKFTASSQATTAEKLTTEGTIIGTPDYLSPEQAKAEAIDARSDIYSMGVILFEALTGRTPFKAETPLGIVLQHLDAEPPRPSSLAPGVDPKLEAICLRCLKKSPEDRYPSAREMRAAFAPESMRPPGLAPGLAPAGVPNLLPKTPLVPRDLSVKPRPDANTPLPSARAPRAASQVTPPPVSSTPAPVPLLLTKKAPHKPAKNPSLSEVGGIPEPSAAPGIILAVAVVAVVAVTGAWLLRSGGRAAAGSVRVAPNASGETAAPSAPPIPSAPPEPKAPPQPLAAESIGDAGLSFLAGTSSRKSASARVFVGRVVAMGVSAEPIVAALPGDAIAGCYRDALKSGPFAGKGTLHLEFEKGITKASFGGEPAVARLDGCIEGASKGVTPGPTAAPGANADVEIVFSSR